ncbi:hypothetical protein F0P96_18810 [Hymenobacter busanensis]|uniref:Uncharacterized protein n=1 Tax=Hymenobacter busanensis TaxID=2607656 RepID=A0A7L4ZSM2_9BACT|nr:hypothetical protein [Hymenobacter busanensis]KAA9325821.1 hypothetical protein F0P96_18810 [Hymenobacter busanensis]QHJ06339.1 hypothetical protein GUY19_03115 [Hymenobacter busanensis]
MNNLHWIANGLVVVAGLLTAQPKAATAHTEWSVPQLQPDVWWHPNSDALRRSTAYAARDAARKVPEGARASAVRAIGRLVRAYAESSETKTPHRYRLLGRTGLLG